MCDVVTLYSSTGTTGIRSVKISFGLLEFGYEQRTLKIIHNRMVRNCSQLCLIA